MTPRDIPLMWVISTKYKAINGYRKRRLAEDDFADQIERARFYCETAIMLSTIWGIYKDMREASHYVTWR